jgi:hypothetical protein
LYWELNVTTDQAHGLGTFIAIVLVTAILAVRNYLKK